MFLLHLHCINHTNNIIYINPTSKMFNVKLTFTCDSRTHTLECSSNEIIRESVMKFIKSKPEYYKQIITKGFTLNGEKIDPDLSFFDNYVENEDNILIICDFRNSIKSEDNLIGKKRGREGRGRRGGRGGDSRNRKKSVEKGENGEENKAKKSEICVKNEVYGTVNDKTAQDLLYKDLNVGVETEANVNLSEKTELSSPILKINEIILYYNINPDQLNDSLEEDLIYGIFYYLNKANLELYCIEDNVKIDDYKYTFKKAGEYRILLRIKGKITAFTKMFYKINLSKITGHLDVSFCTDFSNMFCCCERLVNIDGLKCWDVSKGTNFASMFSACKNLENLDALIKWNVGNGINFNEMFCSCYKLSNINGLSNWNMNNAVNLKLMFNACFKLKHLKPLRNWSVSKVSSMFGTFYGCYNLRRLSPLATWDVKNVVEFKYMFANCLKLSNIDALSFWNVEKGVDFFSMFCSCRNLAGLGALSKWNVANGKDFGEMFKNCSDLSNIEALEKWNVSRGSNVENMFEFCCNLAYSKIPLDLIRKFNIKKEQLI